MMGVHGLWLSVVQAVVIVMCSQGFIAMPITFGSLPFDLAFFTGGILAKRNNWLDTIHNMERKLVWAYRTRATIVFFVFLGVFVYSGVTKTSLDTGMKEYGDDYFDDVVYNNATQTDDDDISSNALVHVLFLLGVSIACGLWCMYFSVTLMQGFYEYMNTTGPWCKFMAEASYTVYIIHPWVITPVSYAWVRIMALEGQDMWWPAGATYSGTTFLNSNVIILGWLFCVVISVPLVYFLAHYLRQLPHLRTIL
mmetsp:Transcript_61675/g.169625  ORF Transcript_61675/g.169625 Transcript_61675/m.169625 type:complete len:252 (-) Transcript_61675:92-847(-)